MAARRRAIVTRMGASCHAVRSRGTAFFISLVLTLYGPTRAQAETAKGSVLEQLVQQASESVQERYTRPLGRVAERRRDRVFVILRQLPPPPGTLLEVVRGAQGQQPERVVARLEILHSETGLTECREQERFGRAHAEAGDVVRRPLGSTRLLLSPCVSLVELAPEIPDVIGEKLRVELQHSNAIALVDDPDAEHRAEAAYLSSSASEFVARANNVDEVLYPVLLQTPSKMVLNLEYYNVERGRATDIDAVSVALDDLMRAWLRAGRARQGAPPGFRRLPPQTYSWRVAALGESPSGDLVVVDQDSVHVMRFQFPGVRSRFAAALGPRLRKRREPWCALVGSKELLAGGVTADFGTGLHVMSDERRPQLLLWPQPDTPDTPPQLRPGSAEVESALERLWAGLRPQARRSEARWWPSPGQMPSVLVPCFADLDQDGKLDLVWTDTGGILHVKLAAQRNARSFPGFGDAKAAQPPRAAGGRAAIWLTDPVWHGEPDRLHEAQLSGDDLELVWSSEPYDGTITALASVDLNADGAADLVVAEALEDGTRLHAFLGVGGERAPRTGATENGGRR